jgi:sRNA-binding protein
MKEKMISPPVVVAGGEEMKTVVEDGYYQRLDLIPEQSTSPIDVIQLLEQRWPACFSVYAVRRRPLRVGIHFQIIAELAGTIAEADIRRAIAIYTSNVKYQKKLKAGKDRIGLDGLPDGKVTEEQEIFASFRIASYNDAEWHRRTASAYHPSRPPPDEDPNGKWSTRRHPSNADKPMLSLWPGRRS